MTSHEVASAIDSSNSSLTKVPSIWFSPLFDNSQRNCWNQSTPIPQTVTIHKPWSSFSLRMSHNRYWSCREPLKSFHFINFHNLDGYCGKFNYHPSLQCSSLELWQFTVYLYNYPNAENAVINPHWLIGFSRDLRNFCNSQHLKQSNRTEANRSIPVPCVV